MARMQKRTRERLEHVREYLDLVRRTNEKRGMPYKGLAGMVRILDEILTTHQPSENSL